MIPKYNPPRATTAKKKQRRRKPRGKLRTPKKYLGSKAMGDIDLGA